MSTAEERKEKARAAARSVVDKAFRRAFEIPTPRAEGHKHRGRCGHRCFLPAPPNSGIRFRGVSTYHPLNKNSSWVNCGRIFEAVSP